MNTRVIPITSGEVSRPKGLAVAHATMIAHLIQLLPNEIIGEADAADFENRRDHLLAVAAVVDAYVLALGEDAKYHASSIDIGLFKNRLSYELNGNASFDLDTAAAEANAERYEGCSRGPMYRARP